VSLIIHKNIQMYIFLRKGGGVFCKTGQHFLANLKNVKFDDES